MAAGTPGDLMLEVRLLAEPCLWCWEIHRAHDGRFLEDSWSSHWEGYESREAALEAGRRRLGELGRARPALPRAS